MRFFGPVMGQLVKESGQRIGQPFEIFTAGVLPDVAYNAARNEYLVVTEQLFNYDFNLKAKYGPARYAYRLKSKTHFESQP